MIDLTRDINIALYFGMGGEDSKKGKFNLIWKEKTLFEEAHGNQLKDQNKTIGEMEGMLLSDLEGLTLGQMAGLGEDVEITLEYLESRMFDNDYKRFFNVQDEYTFVPHKEENIERLYHNGWIEQIDKLSR